MKNSGIKCLIPALFLVLFSCQKSNEQGSQKVTLHVSEFKTNLPIAGAQVSLYDRGAFDFWTCGCYLSNLMLQGTTDYKGDFTVSRDIYNKATMGIGVSKVSYTQGGGENDTTQFTLSAIETIRLRLVEVNPHPGQIIIWLDYKGETNQSIGSTIQTFWATGIPDTTLTLPVYGEQINTFTLMINDSTNHTIETPGPFLINVSRTDSSNVKEIDY